MITKEKQFLSLSNDLLFKEAFAHPDNRDILIYFLSCFTDFTKEYLESVEIRVEYESVLTKTKSDDSSIRGDVIIKFGNHIVNLEAYSRLDKNSFDKSMLYSMRIYSTQLDRGNTKYNKLESVTQINVVYDVTPKDLLCKEDFEDEFVIISKKTKKEVLSSLFQIKYYRIDFVNQMVYDKNNLQQRWLRFIGAQTAEERKEIARGDELLMAFDKWCEEYVNDERTKKIFADWSDYIAENKGFEKGEALGIQKGSQEKAYNIAQNMLNDNIDLEMIKKYTGLSMKEIKSLA